MEIKKYLIQFLKYGKGDKFLNQSGQTVPLLGAHLYSVEDIFEGGKRFLGKEEYLFFHEATTDPETKKVIITNGKRWLSYNEFINQNNQNNVVNL